MMAHGGNSQRTIGNDNNINNGGIKSKDRLSLLPDSILVSILSLLPIKSAAATAALSRRWRHLWTSVTTIRQADRIFPNLTSSAIDAFEFHGPLPSSDAIDDFSSFISRLCALHVKKLEVIFTILHFFWAVPMPPCVFQTLTLEILILSQGFSFTLPDNGVISLPNLRILRVSVGKDDIEFMMQLFESCPNLEDLWVDGRIDGGEIAFICKNLKRLHLSIHPYNPINVVIDAPKLEYFYVGGSHLVRYSFANAMSSLVEAQVCTSNEVRCNDNTLRRWDLLRTIHTVRTLTIGSEISLDDWYNMNGVLPFFLHLKELRMSSVSLMCLRGLMRLLHNCPSLEVLMLRRGCIKWHRINCRSDVNCLPICLSTKLKRIEIWNLMGSSKELELICSILNVAKVLETLVVAARVANGTAQQNDRLDFCRVLDELRRSSLTCQIHFLDDCLDTLSKGKSFLA